jgi:Protein of unknown function (DUF4233)
MTAMAQGSDHHTGPADRVPGGQGPAGQGPAGQGPAGQGPGGQGPAPRGRGDAPATKRLVATVLIMETVVIWLAIPVALAVEHASPRKAGVAGVVLAVVAVVLAAMARRRLRWTIVGGSVLQALVIAAGAIVPVMYFLGAIFAAFWVIGLRLGHRLDVASSFRLGE